MSLRCPLPDFGKIYYSIHIFVKEDAMSKHHTPNDQRSIAMNPNNPAHQAALVNRSVQLNPNNQEYKGSESKNKGEQKK